MIKRRPDCLLSPLVPTVSSIPAGNFIPYHFPHEVKGLVFCSSPPHVQFEYHGSIPSELRHPLILLVLAVWSRKAGIISVLMLLQCLADHECHQFLPAFSRRRPRNLSSYIVMNRSKALSFFLSMACQMSCSYVWPWAGTLGR